MLICDGDQIINILTGQQENHIKPEFGYPAPYSRTYIRYIGHSPCVRAKSSETSNVDNAPLKSPSLTEINKTPILYINRQYY